MAVTERTADKPAKIAGSELPGRALFFLFRRTSFSIPAGYPVRVIFL